LKLTWVNHASFLLESGEVSLICDPWLEGTAFDNGWRLFAPSKFSYSDFSRVTHVWLSHEHPDHFHPSTLNNIPADFRARIQVLFHETEDKRVVSRCRAMGFQVRELPEGQKVSIGPDFSVTCGRDGLIDSWIAIFAEGKTILNTNDCAYESESALRPIRRAVGKVDVLLTQFSCAGWVGNPIDEASHRRHATIKRWQIATQARVFQPNVLIPAASFVYYCHAENQFMNECVADVGEIHKYVAGDLGAPCMVLYPGDEWDLTQIHDSVVAIQSYRDDFQRARTAPTLAAEPVALEKLQTAAAALVDVSLRRNTAAVLRALPTAKIRLRDLDCDLQLSYRNGLASVRPTDADIVMSSEALHYSLSTEWGGDTLLNNCRFEIPPGGRAQRFFRLLRVPAHNAYGNTVNLPFVARRLISKARYFFDSETSQLKPTG
jgi:UDP-MurNAc hydroxylase